MDKQQNNLQNDTTNARKRLRLTETLQQHHVTKFTDLKSEWVTSMIKGFDFHSKYQKSKF
jgi:hypothetical protein